MRALNRVGPTRVNPTTRSAAPACFQERAGAAPFRGRFSTEPGPSGHALGSALPMPATLLHTPLHDRHVELGARMVPFAGWEMPVQYSGVIPEHRAVRVDAGVFDVSHMGELEVEGPHARDLLQSTLSNDLDRLSPGQAQYTLLTNEDGGIIDDLIVYRVDAHSYLLVVNAANRGNAFTWLKEREIPGSDVRD